MTSKTDTMGFPPGAQSKLLAKVNKYYENLAAERDARKAQVKSTSEKPRVEALPEKKHKELTQVSSESEKRKSENNPSDKSSADSGKAGSVDIKPSRKTIMDDPTKIKNISESVKSEVQSTSETLDAKDSSSTSVDNKNLASSSIKDEKEKQTPQNSEEADEDPELTKMQQLYQSNPESYNGAVRDNYSWSQSIADVDVRVKVPKNIVKGNQVQVVTDKKHIKVGYKASNGEMQIVVDDDLTWEVHKDESIWSLVPGEHIHINLEKKEERWWEGLVVNEPKINVRKIDCSRPMTDLDDAAQAKIGEMMYNEQQKRMGLPQSHEQKTHEMMKKAWNAEGSPFRGQEYDPSKFSVNSGVISFND